MRWWIGLVVWGVGCSSGEDTGPDDSDSGDADVPRDIVLDARFGTGADTLGDGVQEFVDTLEAGSSLTVQLAETSQGGGLLAAVSAGDVDLGIDILSLQDSGNADLNAILDVYGDGVPFGLDAEAFLAWFDATGDATLQAALVDAGFHEQLRVVPVIANTGQTAGMFKFDPTRADFQTGFLMRTFGIGQAVVAEAYPEMTFIGATGGSVGNIIAGFDGTLTGADCPDGSGPCELQGAEFVNACVDGALIYGTDGIAATHYATTIWQTPITMSYVMFRADRFTASEVEAIVLAAASNAEASRTRLEASQPGCLDALVTNHGQTVTTLPGDVVDDLETAWSTVRADWVTQVPALGELLDSME